VSNTIIRPGGRIFASWHDGPSLVQVATFDAATGQWTAPTTLGEGQDNHAGTAITMDGAGHLYAAIGPHRSPTSHGLPRVALPSSPNRTGSSGSTASPRFDVVSCAVPRPQARGRPTG
jgi:hypothetical protein